MLESFKLFQKALKLYRVYIGHTESKREEDTVIQTGSGKITATGAAAIEFVEGAVNNHNKRADIHEWYNGKALTDEEAAPDDDTAPPEQNLKQTKKTINDIFKNTTGKKNNTKTKRKQTFYFVGSHL